MKILGIGSPFGHDPSASLLVDGRVVAAAEEERFTREKHASGEKPLNAINFCLREGGLKPEDIDYVAFPWSFNALRDKRVEYFLRTMLTRPSRAYKKFFRNSVELNGRINFVNETLKETGFDLSKTKVEWVEHHLAHAASSYYFSGVKRASVLSIDAGGEITSTLIGKAKEEKIQKIKEIIAPDSLGWFYSTITDYLGFKKEDGEYKVMGMAPYGDFKKANLDYIISWNERKKTYRCNDNYVWVQRKKRFRKDKVYSKDMVKDFGPEREGDGLSEPYVNIAATTQKKLEDITIKLIDTYLKSDLLDHGNLCFSGGCALNVALNRVILEVPYIKNLWVQPASNDSGTSLGASAYLASRLGDEIEPMKDVYLGPEFTEKEIEDEIRKSGYPFTKEKNICESAAKLLQEDKVVGWFQGKMEWGPRALGNRSILGNPAKKETADKINAIIKFREKWRPFCPSILKEFSGEILGSSHPAPFMTIGFKVNPKWQERISAVVHVNGTARPQVVDKETNPKFYELIDNFRKLTGIPLLLNTSLNRRGEPMICSPKDAILMFKGSGLKYLAMGDFLVRKK